MDNVRIAIAGLGNMGLNHARLLREGQVSRMKLVAVIDSDAGRLAAFPDVPGFSDLEECLAHQPVDALLVATPHFSHPALGIAGLRAGLHVLVEKPLAVDMAGAAGLLAAHRDHSRILGVMLNQRTDPAFQALRGLIRDGELGELRRVQWTITDWFRPEAYFAGSTWRGTWDGEGGGVLLNQSPHQLDLLWWLFGTPVRVRAFCHFGKYHRIEVEDEVTAYLEYANGATAVFVTSTGESPGTNRLEVAADRGRVVLEGGRIDFLRNAEPVAEFSRRTREPFARPACQPIEVPLPPGKGTQHAGILANFAAAILDGTPLLAPAAEAIHAVELANAMLLSTWLERTVELPIDADLYARELRRRRNQFGTKP